MLAALLMIGTLPFFNHELPISTPASLVIIAILGLSAGFTDPRQWWMAVLNAIIAIVGTVAYGYFGVTAYETYSEKSWLFWVNEALALIFVTALYYSAKTVRGMANRKHTP